MTARSPISADIDLTSVVVLANGKDVSGAYELLAIEVEKGLFRVARARVTLRDGSAVEEDFAASASDDFAPGSEIEIQAGYHGKVTRIFAGLVWGQRLRVLGETTSVLVLDCRDKAVKATVRRKYAVFADQTDGAAIQTAMGSYGVTTSISGLSGRHACLLQWDATDWDFAMIRAQVNGCIAFAEDGVVTVAKPDLGATPALGVTYGDDVLDFDLKLGALTQVRSAAADAWDPASQQMNSASASSTNSNPLGSDRSTTLADLVASSPAKLKTTADVDPTELQSVAAAAAGWADLSKVTGTVRFQGSALIRPGSLLELGGLGKRFNGRGLVSEVRQEIRDGVWTTQVELGIDPAWFATLPDVSGPPAAGLVPPVRGLQAGVVKAIVGDPEAAYRVQVEVPVLDSPSQLVWARLANFYASNRFGDFFYPEIGDEVVLGFFNADPRSPVILGFLYSKARPPAVQPDESNTQKSVVTRSGLTMVFDETQRSVLLKTPDGKQALLNDADKTVKLSDENDNVITLTPSGVSIKSPKNIDITAEGSISLSAGLGLTASSKASVSVSADMELTAKGALSTSVTSEGNTTIKGLLVMIN